MIRYALQCAEEHRFEAWFSSSSDYDRQAEAGLVECPHCGSLEVRKQVMAPAIARGERRETMAAGGPQGLGDFETLARKVQAHIRNNFDYVGPDFANEARAMHAGDKPERLIYGEATREESEKLAEDGIPCAPLPAPFAPVPPKKAN
ncbi:DUF1178 family protein [Marinicauda algicola]|uniref:DUF1178 family protein n=1 Tax=Marinicauda algicola TaxID=2029849 RepID=A0A4V6RF61_9PROT|nr:DUF1178 family protein [Marinicauda algicola]TGY90229.1 DUF1178 family protein [Marinicauda algicola]